MENKLDHELFSLAKLAAINIIREGKIGLLSERAVHSATKYYLQPDGKLHELKHGGFVCDCVRDGVAIEIQSSGFHRLTRKLEAMLPHLPVMVVYPVSAIKHIILSDENSGEIISQRKSPRRKKPCSFFEEIFRISSFVGTPCLTFRIISYEIEEYRVTQKKTYRNKKGYRIDEKIPINILSDISINSPEELLTLLPELPEFFTASAFQKACQLSNRATYATLKMLTNLSLLNREKVGRAFIFSIKTTEKGEI